MINPYGAALLQRIRDLETECERRAATSAEAAFSTDAARRALATHADYLAQDAMTVQRYADASHSATLGAIADGMLRASGAMTGADALLAHAYTVFDPTDPVYAKLPRCPACRDQPDTASLDEPDAVCATCHGTGADTRPTLLELCATLRARLDEHLAAANADPAGPHKNQPHLADLWHSLDAYLTSNTPAPANPALIAAVETRARDDVPY
jgi:hypothetical protein